MRKDPIRPAIVVAVMLAVAILLAPILGPAPAGAVGRQPATTPEPALTAEIAEIAPLVLTPADTLTVSVTVANSTAGPLEGVAVALLGQEWTPSTRSALTRWLDLGAYQAGSALTNADIGTLAPGQSASVTLTVPAGAFRFRTWGPRGLEVRATSTTAGVDPARVRSWTTFWNEPEVAPTEIGFLAPVAETAAELSGEEDSGPRLESLLPLLRMPGVTPVVDPALLGTPGLGAALDADLLALPWRAADLPVLAAAGTTALSRELAARERDAWAAADLEQPLRVLWPRTADATTLDALPSETVVVVGSGTFSQLGSSSYTSDAVARLAGHEAVVLDEGLVQALSGSLSLADGTAVQFDQITQRQYLAAATAVITRERPSVSRLMIAALPWDCDGDLGPLLQSMDALPWVATSELAGHLGQSDANAVELDASELPATPDLPAETLQPATARAVQETLTELDLLSEATSDRAVLTDALRDRLLAVPSEVLRDRPNFRGSELAEIRAELQAIATGVSIVTPSEVNMISEATNFPVTVVNNLPAEAAVVVRLTPSDPRLRQVARQVLTVPANTTATAQVPVVAVGSANLTVEVQLTTAAGHPLGPPTEVTVRLRPEWENIALVTLVAASGLALIYGIFRTIRRNRASNRAAEIGVAADILAAEDARKG